MVVNAVEFIEWHREAKRIIRDLSCNRLVDRVVFDYLSDRVEFVEGGEFIGERVRINYRGIAYHVSERQGQGSRSLPKEFLPHDVRNSVERLVKLGLFHRESAKGRSGRLVLKAAIGELS